MHWDVLIQCLISMYLSNLDSESDSDRATANPFAFGKIRKMCPSLRKIFEYVMYNLNNPIYELRPEESGTTDEYPFQPCLVILDSPPPVGKGKRRNGNEGLELRRIGFGI